MGQHLSYQLEALTPVVYQVLVEEYLVVLIFLLTLMDAWAVEVVVDLVAPALLFLPAVAVAAMSSWGSTRAETRGWDNKYMWTPWLNRKKTLLHTGFWGNYGCLVSKGLSSGCAILSITRGMLYIGSIGLMSGRVSGTSMVSGTSVNNGSATGASGLGWLKYDFINLPEGNLIIITPLT